MHEDALVALGQELKRRAYAFVTVTPSTHALVNARPDCARARDLRGVFGWSRPFDEGLLDSTVLELARAAGILTATADGLRSSVRWSSLGPDLFAHSAFPTDAPDAVFFGPDTVRFAAFIGRAAPRRAERLVDIGCGNGAGGIVLARRLEHVGELLLADVNPRALELARVNAKLAGVTARCVVSDVLDGIDGPVDLAISNPPYLVDAPGREYRDGGGALGAELSLRIADAAAARLARGGRLLLYTGVAIVDGIDPFRHAVERRLATAGASAVRYEEVDPDVFGEELREPAYASVERIAAVALDATFPAKAQGGPTA